MTGGVCDAAAYIHYHGIRIAYCHIYIAYRIYNYAVYMPDLMVWCVYARLAGAGAGSEYSKRPPGAGRTQPLEHPGDRKLRNELKAMDLKRF